MTALKTISSRIRGSTTDLEELGEDTEDLAQGFSKYATEIKAITGFDILVEGTTDTYKDLYDIFDGLEQVWDKLSDTQQARVAEILGGTRQLQVVSSILNNWSDAAGAYSDAISSAGTATEANATYMDSIEGRLSVLQATFQEFSSDLLNSGLIEFFVDLGTAGLNMLDTLEKWHLLIPDIISLVATIQNLRKMSSSVQGFKTAGTVFNSLPTIDTSSGEQQVASYARSILDLNDSQQKYLFYLSRLQPAQQQSIQDMIKMAQGVRSLSVANAENIVNTERAANGLEAVNLAQKFGVQSTDKLTASMLLELVASGDITAQRAKELLSTSAQEAANEKLGDSYEALSLKQKLVAGISAVTPLQWIQLAISLLPLLISGVEAIYDLFTFTSEEAHEAAEDLTSAFEETQSSLESVSSELETSKSRLDELQKSADAGTITLVEQEELEKLEREVALLEQRNRLLQEQSEREAIDTYNALMTAYGMDTQDTYVSDFNVSDFKDRSELDGYFAAHKDAIEAYTSFLNGLPDEYAAMSEAERQASKDAYDTYQQMMQDAGLYTGEDASWPDTAVSWPEYINSIVDAYEELKSVDVSSLPDEEVEAYRAAIDGAEGALLAAYDTLEQDFADNPALEYLPDSYKQPWLDLIDLIDRTLNAAEYFNDKAAELPTEVYNKLKDMGEGGGLTVVAVKALAAQYPALQEWMDKYNYTAPEVADNFNLIATSADNTSGSLSDAASSLSEVVTALDALSEVLSPLATAFQEVTEDGKISYGTLSDIAEQFSSVEGIDKYISALAAAGGNADEVSDILSELTDAMVKQKLAGINLAQADENLIASMLDEVGIANSAEHAHWLVAEAKAENIAESYDLVNATDASIAAITGEIQGLFGEGDAAQYAEKYVAALRMEQILANENSLDSTDSVNSLIAIATAAGYTASAVTSYANTINRLGSGAGTGGFTLSELSDMRASAEAEAQKIVDDIKNSISTALGSYTYSYTPKSSSSSSSSSKNIEEYIADIDAYRDALERLRKTQEAVEDLESKIDDAGSYETKIALERDLIQAYQDEQAALHALNDARDDTLRQDVAKLTSLGFNVSYDADKNELWIENLEHINELTAQSAGEYDTLQEATNALREDTEDLIDTMTELNESNMDGSDTWEELRRSILDAKLAIYEFQTQAHENTVTLTENWLNNAISAKDSAKVQKYTSAIIAQYQALQDVYHQQAETLRSEGYSDLSDEVSELSDAWWDVEADIKTARDNLVDYFIDIVDAAHDALDEIQDVSSTLSDAAQEYAENGGWISIDTYQEILKLGPEYMQMLTDENGLLVINEERVNNVIAAKTRELAVEQALTYVERLRLAATGQSNENLDQLCFATTEATDSTWGLVYAELALMKQTGQLNDEQYEAALHNIQAIYSLSENAIAGIGKTAGAATDALEEEKESLESLKEELEDMKDGCDDLVDYVMDMLKDKIEQQIDALNDAKDAVADYVDQLKEAMQAEKDNADYEEDVADQLKEIAKLQAKIDALSLDDSRKAQAEKASLEEELAELQKSLADTQAEHAIEVTEDALDQQYDAYEEEKDAEIDALEESISSTQKLYDMA